MTSPDSVLSSNRTRKSIESVEFAATFSDRFTVVSDEIVVRQGEGPNQSDLVSETDNDRPHNHADDSNASIPGTGQTNLQALCKYASIEWAAEIVLYDTTNPGQTLTTVIRLNSKI